jgi:hypothetical protein
MTGNGSGLTDGSHPSVSIAQGAQATNYSFELWVRPTKTLSGPLQEAVNNEGRKRCQDVRTFFGAIIS